MVSFAKLTATKYIVKFTFQTEFLMTNYRHVKFDNDHTKWRSYDIILLFDNCLTFTSAPI